MLIPHWSKRVGIWAVLATALGPSFGHSSLPSPDLELGPRSPGAVVILGERHGQPWGHHLFLAWVQKAVRRGDRVLVGLEIPAERQSALDAVLRGERSPEGLVHPILDCPSYRALLTGLRDLSQKGPGGPVVKAIDAPSGSGTPREVAMATEVLAAVRGCSHDRVVVLVGNLHALKAVPWSPAAASAGPRLAELLSAAGVQTASVLQAFEGECDGDAEGTFYGPGEEIVTAHVRSLWDGLNTVPETSGLAERAADGVILWRCPN